MSAPGADLLSHQEDSRRSHPGEAGPSRHRLTCRVLEQSSQTTPRLLRLQDTLIVHDAPLQGPLDCRLELLNHHVPDLSGYIRDKVEPRRREDPNSITRQSIPFHSPPLCTESKATWRGAPRAPPPSHFVISFLSDEGETPPAMRQTLGLAPS
jgi:hypothetical protein